MSKVFLFVLLASRMAFAGFQNPADVPNFPLINSDQSVFKLQIESGMHGTAFAVASNVLITNVHNITQCLNEHGLLETGYSGERGPLRCSSMRVEAGGRAYSFSLLGSNPRINNDDLDFAAILVPGLKARPLRLSSARMTKDEKLWTIGFPSETFRSVGRTSEKAGKLIELMEQTFESLEELKEVDPGSKTSEDLFNIYLGHFTRLQPLVSWSEYLSGALLGSEWNPLLAWRNEDPASFHRGLISHLEQLKWKIYGLMQIVERARTENKPAGFDADGELKVSPSRFHRLESNGIAIIAGDATPGSSGSAVVDETGSVRGILFQLRTLDGDSKSMCVLDALMSDFESIRFSRCRDMGVAVVPAEQISDKLSKWQSVRP